jgi:Protein of unknown function (DUF664)
MTTIELSQERLDLLESLTAHRAFLRRTAQGLTDEQARMRPTVSELCVGGIVKHVAAVEQAWATFMVDGSGVGLDPTIDWANPDPAMFEAWQSGFRLLDTETLDGVLADYERIAAATDQLVADIADLDRTFALPPAPWFTPGATRSVRRAIIHIVGETAQHAGHADIIRESIDGAKTMG